jgi:hypothetical protein
MLRLPATPRLNPEASSQSVFAPPTKFRLLYCLLATLVAKEVRVKIEAAVLLYVMVLPVMVCVPEPGEKPWLMLMMPEEAQVRFPFPVLFNWP